MSLIEQAAKRLEELRLAGVDIPVSDVRPMAAPASPVFSPASAPIPAPAPAPIPSAMPGAAERSFLDAATAGASAAAHTWNADGVETQRVEIDLAALSASGIIRPDAPRSQVADEYRVIKRPLIANAMGKGAAPIVNGNLIMVTSALPGEGKSFTAANLAMSIAMELDNTVMLVDADVSRPSLLRMMGLPPARGLLDLLVDESIDLRDVLLRSNVEKLSILPSGTQHPRATELLASDAMVRLLEEMASRYSDRIIVFDSPPLLVTTEARVLASRMGQVVVVVKAEGTAQSDVKHALAAIEACPIRLMLLNQAKSGSQGSYGYGYGYGYGSQSPANA